ncbi:hypothetical protein PWT90_04554 [Aphanocladium album]|nr:hypothetical protein PWT90_04554 [Aphanocladium album]
MRIGCLQFAPQVGDIENNLNRADAVLSKANIDELDLMVLPELAFTGYNFKSLQDISPFLEPSGSGITSLWARTMALRYNCVVTAGYPEKVDVSPKWPTGPEYYNSAIVVNADGETIANYRKSFLYYTDESWALEGKGFYKGFIPGLGNTAIGICMDLNPYKFEAPWSAYEFAFHVLEMQTNLVILSMAWMTREESRMFSRMPDEPDMETLTYWVTRLEPLIRAETEGEIIIVFCNRTGNEGEAVYAGTSAVIGIENGEVRVYGLLGRGQKELLVVDTSEPPYAKLVYRPEDGEEEVRPDEIKKSSSDETDLTAPDHTTPATSDQGSDPDLGMKAKSQDNAEEQKNNKANDMESKAKANAPPAASDVINVPATIQQDMSRGRSLERKAGLVPPPPPMMPVFPGNVSKDETNSPLTPAPKDLLPTTMAPTSRNTLQEKPPMTEKKAVTPIDVSAANSGVLFRSPATEGPINIPLPSLPSPREQALRPKLIIPQSPPMHPQQMYPSNPVSARSTFSERSERSIQSVKSDESEASTQTIRSNPRPPEDSTPYPHSGMPLSGYPQKKKIYGGYVSIKTDAQFSSNFSPTTPFEDMSPVSASWYWRPPDSALRTPKSAGGWFPGTPIGRKPEPFPWHALGSARSRSRTGGKYTPAKTPEPGTAITAVPHGAGAADFDERRKTPMRPSSPKSRNASRSRTRNRSGSALSQREYSVVSQHLEDVSKRVGSVDTTKEVYAKEVYAKEAAQSAALFAEQSTTPKSHAYSSSIEDKQTSPWGSAVPIAASPSILERDVPGKMVIPTPVALDYYRPIGAAAYHQRSNSFSTRDEYYSLSPVVPAEENNIPRTISRGRQPGPVATADRNGKAIARSRERTTSADSTRNDVLHHRVRRSSNRDEPGPSDRNNSRNHRHRSGQSSRAEDRMEFERVEAIVCPNCPVHGRRSSSSTTNGRSHRSSRCRNHGQSASQEPGQRSRYGEGSSTVSTSSRHTETHAARAESDAMSGPVSAPLTASQLDETISPTVARGIQRPITAPSTFNPPTPKAMPYRPTDDEEDDRNGEFTLLEASVVTYAEEKTPTTVQMSVVA